MNKKQAKILIKEFEKAYYNYSVSNFGHWKKDWKVTLKYAELKKGYWYWKGYRLTDLYNLICQKQENN